MSRDPEPSPLADAAHDQIHRPRREPAALRAYEQRPLPVRDPLTSLLDPRLQRVAARGVQRHLPVHVAVARAITNTPLRADIEMSSMFSAASSCSRGIVYSNSVTIAPVPRPGRLRRTQQRALLILRQRPRRDCASGSRLTFAGPNPRNRLK